MGIAMSHPDIEVLGEAADETQFRLVWEPRGWERVAPEVAVAVDITGERVTSLDSLLKDQLLSVAAQQGVEVSPRSTKAEIIEALTAAVAPEVLESASADEEG